MKSGLKQSLFSLTAIQLGGAFCLPVIMAGQMLAQSAGPLKATIAVLLGNIFLYGIACLMGRLTFKYRVNTLELAKILLGKKGAAIGSVALLVPMIGWFAIQLDFIGRCFSTVVPDIPAAVGCAIAGIGLVALVQLGIRGVGFLSTISLPLLALATGVALYRVVTLGAVQVSVGTNTLFSAVVTAIAIALAAVVDIPTYYRFASSQKTMRVSLLLVFLVGLPLIEGIGIMIGTFLPGKTLIDVFAQGGTGMAAVVMTLFLGIKGFTTNSTNLYSAAVSIKTLIPQLSPALATVLAGVIGILLSLLPLLENLETALMACAVTTSSLGALFVATVLAGFTLRGLLPLAAWALGVVAGICSLSSFITITGEPVCDAFLVTLITVLSARLVGQAVAKEVV